jgi:hypothetical protein
MTYFCHSVCGIYPIITWCDVFFLPTGIWLWHHNYLIWHHNSENLSSSQPESTSEKRAMSHCASVHIFSFYILTPWNNKQLTTMHMCACSVFTSKHTSEHYDCVRLIVAITIFTVTNTKLLFTHVKGFKTILGPSTWQEINIALTAYYQLLCLLVGGLCKHRKLSTTNLLVICW